MQDYARAAASAAARSRGSPLSLYVHIPFCFSPCFYCGCNKVVTRHLEHADSYVRRLLHEISQRGAYLRPRPRVVEQMHFGGGTPTFLPKKLLIELVDRIGQEFPADRRARPGLFDRDRSAWYRQETLQLLANLGFNRVSLGVQDFDENVQLR